MNRLLGNRIRTLRSERNLTQEEVAARLGFSRQRYARIENGSRSVGLDILSHLAEIFDVTVPDITNVLEWNGDVEYRGEGASISMQKIFDMLDLFYANKHLYEQLQPEYGSDE